MRLVLIGPGDIEFHYNELLNLDKNTFESHLKNISKALAESKTELALLPDRGIAFEIAKFYKQNKGKKVIALLPESDQDFGIKHLQSYLTTQINNKPLFNEKINTENWYKHDMIKPLFGDAVLYLGNSPGTEFEKSGAIYLYKLLTGKRQGVKALKTLHPDIRAKENFTFFIYSPFIIKNKLSQEDEAYIKKFNINLIYIKTPKQLKKELINLS